MKKQLFLLALLSASPASAYDDFHHAQHEGQHAETVAEFQGQQVTGVTVSSTGNIFANFPKWREGVRYDVVAVTDRGTVRPYPDESWNSWKLGEPVEANKFISVQSVVAHGGMLYVLDTANPMFKGVLAAPRLFMFDMTRNMLAKTYTFPAHAYKSNSYANDLRVDEKNNRIYITDSAAPGLIVIDTQTGEFTRLFDDSPITRAETDHLTINGVEWRNTVHSDGIALDSERGVLYLHALTGYTLHAIKLDTLLDKEPVITSVRTAAPDGLIHDGNGNVYFADLENNRIQYITPDLATQRTLIEGVDVSWADTFSIYNCDLYYTNSRIHESGGGKDISQMRYQINKIALPACQP